MSLKAKIEAVIYASEEPVTPAQLVSLLGGEAQAELDAADALQGQLNLLDSDPVLLLKEMEPGDPEELNAETLGTDAFAAVPPDESEPAQSEWESRSAEAPTGHVAAPTADFDTPPSDDPQSQESHTPEPSAAETRARERRLRDYMRSVLDNLVAEYANGDRGLEIREVAGGYRFATKPEYHDAVRGFVRSLKPPLKLSLQALETLAVVAYKQPVTAPEVSEIRGVDTGGVLVGLMTRKLVTTAGRKQVIGRPILYKTTKEFLLRFGLKDLSELPSIEEFERMAGELNEAVQEEMAMPEPTLDSLDDLAGAPQPDNEVADVARGAEPMRNEHSAQADGSPDEVDAENLTPAPDGPGEFTGDESAPPVDNAEIDGRISGMTPNYDEPGDEAMDSPALDAEVQGDAERAGGKD